MSHSRFCGSLLGGLIVFWWLYHLNTQVKDKTKTSCTSQTWLILIWNKLSHMSPLPPLLGLLWYLKKHCKCNTHSMLIGLWTQWILRICIFSYHRATAIWSLITVIPMEFLILLYCSGRKKANSVLPPNKDRCKCFNVWGCWMVYVYSKLIVSSCSIKMHCFSICLPFPCIF